MDVMDELELRIAKLELAPGDVLVVQGDSNLFLYPDILNRMHDRMKAIIGPDVKVMFIDASITLSVLTKAEIEKNVR